MNGNTRPAARNGFRKHALVLALATGLTGTFGATAAQAATWDVAITNLTHGNHFTPLLMTAHAHDAPLFEVGSTATAGVTLMAECGDLSMLETEIGYMMGDTHTSINSAMGLLAPAANTSATLDTTETHLSVVAMVLPTNDAFVGLSQHIPSEAGTYTYYVNAYDAGTEANSEQLTSGCAAGMPGIPAAPGMDAGANGTGVAGVDTNTMIHVHRGVLGDLDAMGGSSDLNSSIHRWQNPVAKITVTVTP